MAQKPTTDGIAGSEQQPFNETVKSAAYGDVSSGKTLLIGDLIKEFGAENVGIISCERGLNTIRSLLDERYIKVADDKASLRDAWAWAQQTFTSPDQWLCVDGGTRCLNWIKDDVFGRAQMAYEQYLSGLKKGDLPAALRPYASFITGKDELDIKNMWARVGHEAERLLNSFVRLPCNMYWTFWEDQTWASAYDKGPPWRPDTPGNNALGVVKGTFDFVCRLEIVDGKRSTAHFRGNPRFLFTKTRDEWANGIKVPAQIPEFNLAAFAKMVKGQAT